MSSFSAVDFQVAHYVAHVSTITFLSIVLILLPPTPLPADSFDYITDPPLHKPTVNGEGERQRRRIAKTKKYITVEGAKIAQTRYSEAGRTTVRTGFVPGLDRTRRGVTAT